MEKLSKLLKFLFNCALVYFGFNILFTIGLILFRMLITVLAM